MDNNPFAVLTLVAAPAILTNAMSVLALGSGNRAGRVMDRFREIMKELKALEPGSEVHAMKLRQLDRLQQRARYLNTAMKAFFTALGSFAATTVVAIVGGAFAEAASRTAVRVSGAVALSVGAFAVGNLVFGCVLLVRDSRLAIANLTEDADLIRSQQR
ncbi:MAG TPA: DUF2721 domain-containing protein [Planctomycetota bacterium]|nr:DUF2721 domain-containing protein [Planctomycetota bacterium]